MRTLPVAALDAVDVTYQGATQDALRHVSLSVNDGEFVSLVGPSGSGKTTALRVLAGFITPTAGRVWLGGRDVTRLPAHRRDVNMVFQSYALFPALTVHDNVAFGLRRRGLSKAEVASRVGAVLDTVGMRSFGDRRPGQLSGGQQQRIAVARALVNSPRVVLLDEPLSALDADLRERMREELRHLQRSTGASFVLVTHDQAEALALSDRIAVLSAGQIVQIGSPQDLYEAPVDEFVARFLGPANVAATSEWSRGPIGWTAACEGGRVSVSRPPAGRTVLVRPHDVRLDIDRDVASRDGRPNHVQGVVVDRTYRGADIKLTIELPSGLRWSVVTPAEAAPVSNTGRRCIVTWDVARTRTLMDPSKPTEEKDR